MTAKDGTLRGGQRDGSGVKPGNRFTAASAALLRQRHADALAAERISPPPHVERALKLHLGGYGAAAIAAKLDRPRPTIVTWLRRHKAWLDSERAAMLADAQRSFSPLLEPTLKAFSDALDSDSMTHRLRAAEGAADRIWGSTVPAGSTPGNTSFSITYIDGSTSYIMPTPSQPITVEHSPQVLDVDEAAKANED